MVQKREGKAMIRRSSPLTPTQKLAKAARLAAEAIKLFAEASDELQNGGRPEPPTTPPQLTEIDRARARRALRRLGIKIP
jgi:hypothetical protein